MYRTAVHRTTPIDSNTERALQDNSSKIKTFLVPSCMSLLCVLLVNRRLLLEGD